MSAAPLGSTSLMPSSVLEPMALQVQKKESTEIGWGDRAWVTQGDGDKGKIPVGSADFQESPPVLPRKV